METTPCIWVNRDARKDTRAQTKLNMGLLQQLLNTVPSYT